MCPPLRLCGFPIQVVVTVGDDNLSGAQVLQEVEVSREAAELRIIIEKAEAKVTLTTSRVDCLPRVDRGIHERG